MENNYRLDEYRIIESDISEIRWEAHFGLAALQEGKCFRKGCILFIGPPENSNAGFLKGEFLDHIAKLPVWSKTPYYCKGRDVYHCSTGHRVSKGKMLSWMLEPDNGRDGGSGSQQHEKIFGKSSGTEEKADVAFRLQRYEIVMKTNGEVCWTTHAGPNAGDRGTCIVLEDILFIETFQSKPTGLNKRSFQANLRRLPKWDQTRFFAPKLSLLDCKSGCRVLSIGERQEEKISKEKKQNIKNRKNAAEVTIPETREKKNLSEGVSDTLNSICQATAAVSSRTRFLLLNLKKPKFPKGVAEFRIANFRTWIISAIAFAICMIAFLFTFIFGVWNEHLEKSHDKRIRHSSSHHGDH